MGMKMTGLLAEGGVVALKDEENTKSIRKARRIWVVVADYGRARIFRRKDRRLELIGEVVPQLDYQKVQVPLRRTGGRAGTRVPVSSRHPLAPHDASLKEDKLDFIRHLAEYISGARRTDAFDSLVLVAAPKTLGDLRQNLDKSVSARIMAELDKDLINMPQQEIQDYLAEIL